MWSALDDREGKGRGSALLRDAAQDFPKLVIKRSFFVPDLHDLHSGPATGAVEGVIAEGEGDGVTPPVQGTEIGALFRMYAVKEGAFLPVVLCIDTIIADHPVMLFRYMAYEARDEFQHGDMLRDRTAALMGRVMEGDGRTVIGIDAGGGDGGPAQVAADVLHGMGTGAGRGLCTDIEAFRMGGVHGSLGLFEGGADGGFHLIEEDGTEGAAEEGVIEMGEPAPAGEVPCTPLGNEAVDVGVPLEVTAEGVEDEDEAGGELFLLIKVCKHAEDDGSHCMEEAVKKGAVFKEEVAELLRYGEDAVAVGAVEHLQGDGGGTLTGIEGAAGRAEAAVAAEGDIFLGTTGRADVHGAALCGIPTVDKPGDVVCLGLAWVHGVDDFLVMVPENFL